MTNLKIHLFGEFQVRRGEEPIPRREWGGQKTRSLLKLLLTRPGHTFSRDEIVEALWPNTCPQAAERSLRVTVSLLRRVLELDLGRGSDSRYILQRRPGYSFDRQVDCWVDTWEFEAHRNKAEAAREAGDSDEAINEYRAALDLLRGEFLAEEPYEDWAMEARQEWEERRFSIFSGLAECLALRGHFTEAIEACERALPFDGYREELHRRLMLYHYCAGEQGVALRMYRDYARMLKEDLDTAPSPDLERLKGQIEARDVPGVDTLRRYPRPRHPLRFPYSLSRTHFVGRDREYAWFAQRLDEVVEGRGGAVVVEGEAGVGKTRLTEEFLGYARTRGIRVLSGRCYERELGPSLEPVIDALSQIADREELVPEMSHSGMEEPGYFPEAEPHDGTRVYQAFTRELIRESSDNNHRALILFVDDVQWADPATLEFLSYSAKRISGERILLVMTYRREDMADLSGWLDHLAERRAITILSLERLAFENTTELLERMSSRAFGELSSLADLLQKESEGNPFYAVEYLRWLIEAGAVELDTRRRLCGLKSEALRDIALPSGVRSLVKARLGSMDSETRDLLELAAVVGRTFDLDLLCKAAAYGEARALDIVEPLLSSGLIVGVLGNTYHFSHDKLRQTLYEDINDHRRRELHIRVAGSLNEADGEPAELAHHYLRAQEWRPALENLVRAARKAQESYAWEASLKNYAQALEIVDKLPDCGKDRFELLAGRERLLEHMDRREERAQVVQEMFELANRLEDRARMAEVHVRRIGVLAALSDFIGAEEAGWAAVEIFRELKDEAGEARAHREIGYVFWTNGDAASLEANFRALRLNRKIGDRRSEAGDMGNIAEVYRGMGDYDQALRWARKAVRIYRELGEKLGEAMRLATVATIHREQGDLKAALRLVLETLRLYTELGTKNLLVAQHSACGTLYLGLGDPQKALEHFQSAARYSREIGYTRDEGYSLMSMGASLEQLGDHAGAVDVYRRAVELLGTAYEASGIPKELSGKADALALLAGALHHSLDEPIQALDAYDAAAEIYRELGDTRRLRKVSLGLAGLRWRLGNPKDSARLYEEALKLAQGQGEKAQEAAALMSLSVVYRDLGRLKESVQRGRKARFLLRDLNDFQAEAYALTSLAESYTWLGYYPSAVSCLRRSLRLRRKIGDEKGEVGVLRDLAGAYEKLGDAERARACSEEAALKEEELVAFERRT